MVSYRVWCSRVLSHSTSQYNNLYIMYLSSCHFIYQQSRQSPRPIQTCQILMCSQQSLNEWALCEPPEAWQKSKSLWTQWNTINSSLIASSMYLYPEAPAAVHTMAKLSRSYLGALQSRQKCQESQFHIRTDMLRHTKPITRLSWAYKNQTTEMWRGKFILTRSPHTRL